MKSLLLTQANYYCCCFAPLDLEALGLMKSLRLLGPGALAPSDPLLAVMHSSQFWRGAHKSHSINKISLVCKSICDNTAKNSCRGSKQELQYHFRTITGMLEVNNLLTSV